MRDWLMKRGIRTIVLTISLYVLSQLWAQMAMEIHFPYHFKIWRFSVVLFYVPEVSQASDMGRTAGD